MENTRKAIKNGFTLIELIIVIAIIALLAAGTFVAVNPAKRVGDSQNAQRWSDVTAIADAWIKYVADNSGAAPTSTAYQGYLITNAAGGVCDAAVSCTNSTTLDGLSNNCIDLHALVDAGYIGDIPDDPGGGSEDYTQYYFGYNSTNNTVVVGACDSYGDEIIEVTR